MMKRRDFLRYGAIGLTAAMAGPAVWERRSRASQKEIVRAAIYPGIGVARVGNSPDEFFLGPESPGLTPDPPGGYKDAAGRMKRQAARFRVYGFDGDGQAVRELTAADAELTWTVHLANAKAAWYEFETAFDIPEAQGLPFAPGRGARPPLSTPPRNAGIQGGERAQLVIDPGPRSIGGRDTNRDGSDPRYACEGGRFFDLSVPLGDLRTDGDGRLLVLGGAGQSRPRTPGATATTFANNDGWHDDVSDGPVDARVVLDGREIPVEGAWVVVAPPNYAPGIPGIVTLYDLMFEVATRLEPERTPSRPSFTRQIYPLLERHVQHGWVNAGFLRDFGPGTAGDFLAPDTLRRLADRSPEARPAREAVVARFRDPAYASTDGKLLPPYYGDSVSFPGFSPRQWMAVLPSQYGWLRQWAEGDFDADWPAEGRPRPVPLEQLPLSEQPDALDRAVLDNCLGGPFHPGCEITWPARRTELYAAPFRIRRRTAPEPEWGPRMTAEIALRPDGPLAGSGPGGLTRWMAIPWQTDTSSCLAAYESAADPYLPSFWPARVPNDVLPRAAYDTVMDTGADPAVRREALRRRRSWQGTVPSISRNFNSHINGFIRDWSRYGVITPQPGPGDSPDFPEHIWVETGRDVP